jgi:3-methylcrotonyl-CoA carboxylase alpha subunit
LRNALADYEVAGVTTNIGFLAALAAHSGFATGGLDTGFIARHSAELLPPAQPASREVLAAAVARVLADQRREAERRAAVSHDPWSPWNQLLPWRMNGEGYLDLVFRNGESPLTVRVFPRRDGSFRADFPDGPAEVSGPDFLSVDGVRLLVSVVRHGDDLTVIRSGVNHHLKWIDPQALHGAEEEAVGRLTAPMPGRIVQVMVEPGAEVKRGAPLLVLEAMKMEYTITAPADGKIEEIRYAAGDVVDEGAELISFA